MSLQRQLLDGPGPETMNYANNILHFVPTLLTQLVLILDIPERYIKYKCAKQDTVPHSAVFLGI